MFNFKNIIFLLICFNLPSVSYAEEACNADSGTTPDMVNCAMIDFNKSDAKLNLIYKRVLPALSSFEQKALKYSQIK